MSLLPFPLFTSSEMRRVSVIFVSLKGLSFQEKSDPHNHPETESDDPNSSKKPRVKRIVQPDTSTPRVMGQSGSSSGKPPAEIVPDFGELNKVLRVMQKVIFRYDGFVRQFLVDDKGRFPTRFIPSSLSISLSTSFLPSIPPFPCFSRSFYSLSPTLLISRVHSYCGVRRPSVSSR